MATATTTARRPGRFSRWLQHTANARTADKIRTHGGTPLAYVDDGTGGWVVVAERDAAWQRLTQAVRSLARYQTKTSRTYPVVRLARR